MNAQDLRSIVHTASTVIGIVEPLEPLLAGIGQAVVAAFASHVKETLPEIEAQWVLNELQSAVLMRPPHA